MAPAMRKLVAGYMDGFHATVGDPQAMGAAASSAWQI